MPILMECSLDNARINRALISMSIRMDEDIPTRHLTRAGCGISKRRRAMAMPISIIMSVVAMRFLVLSIASTITDSHG